MPQTPNCFAAFPGPARIKSAVPAVQKVMDISTHPEWQQLALYAVAAAAILLLLFRLPYVGRLLRGLFSFGLFAFCLFLLFQQASFDPNLGPLAARIGLNNQEVAGEEVRIRMAADGHFWVRANVNGVERRMLVDSGATVSAFSEGSARAASIDSGTGLIPVLMRTANGTVRAQTGTVRSLRVGSIEARNLKVVISPALGNVDVLGMNFLSQLASWRVEDRTLILMPAKPDAG